MRIFVMRRGRGGGGSPAISKTGEDAGNQKGVLEEGGKKRLFFLR